MLSKGIKFMRSILKFLALSLIAFLIPSLVMGLSYQLNLSDMGIIISQMIVIIIFILVFTNIFKYMRKYELDTQNLIEHTRDLGELKKLRFDRKTYRSKAMITSKILSLNYSKDEVANLKKYAATIEDMEHYYSAIIDHAEKKDREALKIRRDNFNKRYGKKQRVYPDFRGNFKTALKWMVFFFILAIFYNILPRYIMKNEVALASFYMLGMIFLAIVMINTILWIVRSLSSYWASDYI